MLLGILKNHNTPDAVLDATVAALYRRLDGTSRPIIMAADAIIGNSALRYALEVVPVQRQVIVAILESTCTGFKTKFGFTYISAAPTLYANIIFLAEKVPSCIDLLVTYFLASDEALIRLPAKRQIDRVLHNFDETGPLIEARSLACDAQFQQFAAYTSFAEEFTAPSMEATLTMVSVECLSQTPRKCEGNFAGLAPRPLLAILLDKNFVAAF
jgi:hypothetical protein